MRLRVSALRRSGQSPTRLGNYSFTPWRVRSDSHRRRELSSSGLKVHPLRCSGHSPMMSKTIRLLGAGRGVLTLTVAVQRPRALSESRRRWRQRQGTIPPRDPYEGPRLPEALAYWRRKVATIHPACPYQGLVRTRAVPACWSRPRDSNTHHPAPKAGASPLGQVAELVSIAGLEPAASPSRTARSPD